VVHASAALAQPMVLGQLYRDSRVRNALERRNAKRMSSSRKSSTGEGLPCSRVWVWTQVEEASLDLSGRWLR
jgi:hypothetical protein